jgi:hypothetical protein
VHALTRKKIGKKKTWEKTNKNLLHVMHSLNNSQRITKDQARIQNLKEKIKIKNRGEKNLLYGHALLVQFAENN